MKYALAMILFFMNTCCIAQLLPAGNGVVNYRLAGFSVPENKKAHSYLFEIATDSVTDEMTFKGHTITKQSSDAHRIIYTLPSWDKKYTWRVSFLDKNKKIIDSTPLYHFSTGYNKFADDKKYRLHIITNKVTNKDMMVFLDGTRTLYDMNGNTLWYLPDIPDVTDAKSIVRDIKITPQHTITFLTQFGGYEIDYNGKLLWKAPNDGKVSGDSIENYHHELIRLNNGDYMITGQQHVWVKLPEDIDTAIANKMNSLQKNGSHYSKNMEFGTLIEYDDRGNVVWSWKSFDHFTEPEILTKRFANGNIPDLRTHLNGFYFDEQKHVMYTSYRDINRIIKIKYPSGDVINAYGENYVRNQYLHGDTLFRAQHSPNLTADRNLLLFNNMNNQLAMKEFMARGIKPYSSIIILKEPVKATDTLKQLWKFSCDIDSLASPLAGNGGNALELKNKSIIACMGSNERCFIVNRAKKIEWNAQIQMLSEGNNWTKFTGYRIYPVESRAIMEGLIFNH